MKTQLQFRRTPSVDRGDEERPELWLVRHGETEWSRLGKHTGRTDIPLTEKGRRQALAAGGILQGHTFSRILSSPLSRAHETARIAGFGDVVETDEDLLEWHYGVWEGRTTAEVREVDPVWTIWTHPVDEGESVEAVGERVDRVIARAREADGNVLLFAHGHVLRILTARWLGLPPVDGRLFALQTATVSILGWERETPVLDRWNETCEVDE
jgi:broad specificity phosphatase PhoE